MHSRYRHSSAFLVIVSGLCFILGILHARQTNDADRAESDARFNALRAEVRLALTRDSQSGTRGTSGSSDVTAAAGSGAGADDVRGRMMADIKQQLQREMGLLPLALLRERRSSFVPLYAYDDHGRKDYGTAGYLGTGTSSPSNMRSSR